MRESQVQKSKGLNQKREAARQAHKLNRKKQAILKDQEGLSESMITPSSRSSQNYNEDLERKAQAQEYIQSMAKAEMARQT